MSYCRWSTDDFACDLYIYEDVSGGWTIHVAGNRTVLGELPEPITLNQENAEAWLARHKLVLDLVDGAERVPIDLPHAGESFNEPTIEATIERVRSLRALGYHCPDRVEERLREESEEPA